MFHYSEREKKVPKTKWNQKNHRRKNKKWRYDKTENLKYHEQLENNENGIKMIKHKVQILKKLNKEFIIIIIKKVRKNTKNSKRMEIRKY